MRVKKINLKGDNIMTDAIRNHIKEENKAYDQLVANGFNPQGWNRKDNTVIVGIPLNPPVDDWKFNFQSFKSYKEAAEILIE